MKRTPIYTFDGPDSIGIYSVPIQSVIQVLNDGTGKPIIFTLLSKKGVHPGTQIKEFLKLFKNYNEAGSDTTIHTSEKGTPNGVVPLGSDGKIPRKYLNTLSINETFIVGNEIEMLALDAGIGDVAIRLDLNDTFIYNGGPTGTVTDWTELQSNSSNVVSVNSQTDVVVLTTDDIPASVGSLNQYYSDAEALTAIGGKIDDTMSAGDNILWSINKINLEINTRARGNIWGTNIQYNIGDIVSHIQKAYLCTTATASIPTSFNSHEWKEIGSYDATLKAAVNLNTTKVGITQAQTDAIDLNTLKISNVDHPLVEIAVPANAVFTDTVYDETALKADVDLNTLKISNVDHPLVEIAVPANAVFTDTVYDETALKAAVGLNSAKVGITSAEQTAIGTNTAKVGITQAQIDAIGLNTLKDTNVDFDDTALEASIATLETEAATFFNIVNKMRTKVPINDANSSDDTGTINEILAALRNANIIPTSTPIP